MPPAPPLLLADHLDDAVAKLRSRAGGRVEILVVAPGDETAAVHRTAAALAAGRPVRVHRSPAAPPAGRTLLERVLAEALAVHGGIVGTLRERSDEWIGNIVAAAPRLVGLPSAASLAGCLAGRPALVVGAGPSLPHLAPVLPLLAARCAVIAAGSALAPLARLGIVPDVAVILEGRCRAGQLAAAPEPGRTLLVVAQHGHPRHLDGRFRGLVRLDAAENGWFTALVSPPARPAATGGNVGTAALALALAWGADPVVLAGLDFAWPPGTDGHAPGAGSPPAGPGHGTFLGSEAAGGGTVRTSALLASYRANTEAVLRAFPGRTVINPVRPGAARIAGTREVAPGGLADLLPAGPRAPLPVPPVPAPPSRERLRAGLAALATDLDEVAGAARRLLEGGASPAELRAELGGLLAARPASFPAAVLRGHLLDPDADPRHTVPARLARGLDWLRKLSARLLP